MCDVSNKYAVYGEILSGEIYKTIVFVGLILLVIAVAAIFLVRWRRSIWNDETGDEQSKSKREWWVSVIALAIISIGALLHFSVHLANIAYDLNHQAYVVLDDKFAITCMEWGGRTADKDTYSIEFKQDGRSVEITPDWREYYYTLESGVYTDTVLVYSQKSEIVVDMFEK